MTPDDTTRETSEAEARRLVETIRGCLRAAGYPNGRDVGREGGNALDSLLAAHSAEVARLREERDEARSEAGDHKRGRLAALDREMAALKRLLAAEIESDTARSSLLGVKAERDALKGQFERMADRYGATQARLEAATRLLHEARPFIGWSSKPDGLIERIDAFLASSPSTVETAPGPALTVPPLDASGKATAPNPVRCAPYGVDCPTPTLCGDGCLAKKINETSRDEERHVVPELVALLERAPASVETGGEGARECVCAPNETCEQLRGNDLNGARCRRAAPAPSVQPAPVTPPKEEP